MNMSGLIAGVIAGIVGAAIWAGVSFYSGYEIGWIAWGIGGIVGIAVVSGSKTPGAAGGLAAALITIISITGGKYVSVDMAVNDMVGDEESIVQESIDRIDSDTNFVISYVADEIIESLDGDTDVNWPEDYDEDDIKTEYPAKYWQQAEEQWNAMAPEDQTAYRDQLKGEVRTDMEAGVEMMRTFGFIGSFGLMDFVFFGLAVITAFKLGSGES